MENLPDYFDLNDWILLNHPEVHRATRYISNVSTQMEAWMKIWKMNGSPILN